MKISNQGLFLTTALAILSIIGLNYWVYNVDFTSVEEEALTWYCGTDALYAKEKLPIHVSELSFADSEEKELYLEGEDIFNANCTQCHAVHERVVGPALRNSWERWESEEELIQFIKYPQKTIDSGKSEYATALFKKYKQYMPNHDFLTDEEVRGLIAYIKGQSGYSQPVASTIP